MTPRDECNAQISVFFSYPLIREASSCRRWEQVQRPTDILNAENEKLEHSTLNGRFPSNPSLQSSGNPLEKEPERV